MSSKTKFLITGFTGGLGASILSTLLEHVPASDIIASSSRTSARAELESKHPGVEFRLVCFDHPDDMVAAFKDIAKLFFVSSNTIDPKKRNRQHANVVLAAKEAGVGHVFYSSLAFGGYAAESSTALQESHIVTEGLLLESGLPYTSVREGIYGEAFPVFLNWWPGSTVTYLPADGLIAFASRAELGEATAKLMLRSVPTSFHNNIALLTGPQTYTLTDISRIVNEVTGKPLEVRRVSGAEYLKVMPIEDVGKGDKPKQFFEFWSTVLQAFEQGEAAVVDPLMEELLGRKPKDGREIIRDLLLKSDMQYTWHQNYAQDIMKD